MINRCETCGASWYADQPAKHLMTCSPTPTEAGSLQETLTVTPTMREKMARTIGDALYGNADPVTCPNNFARALIAADAALDALREPTKAMFDKALSHMDSYSSNGAWWYAMIRAAKEDA